MWEAVGNSSPGTTMLVFDRVTTLKQYLRKLERQGLRIGFVPTMGALHDGHLSLIAQARARAEVVVASVFVNPKQFGPTEDLARYPRDLEGDRSKLASAGCDVLFVPSVEEMYPPGFQTEVEVTQASQGLCGAARPQHFKGVTTVVLRLFSIVHPHVAVFGEKDYQQLTVLRTMARDLGLDVEVIGAPLVREPDGLAMSSRNVYLSPEDRQRALALSRGLRQAEARFAAGERRAAALVDAAQAELLQVGLTAEYLELRDAETLEPRAEAQGPVVLLVACRVGATRLLDNVIMGRVSS
jgi:pantoate--beta-alanine ligase